MPKAFVLDFSRESAIAELWASAFLSVFNLSETADMSATVKLLTTTDVMEIKGLSAIDGVLGTGDLAATAVVAEIEGLSATAAVLRNMDLSETLLFTLWVLAARVCFGVNWAAAEVLFEGGNW